MLIQSDPSKVTLSKDVKNYRTDFDTDAEVRDEYKKELKRRNAAKYPENAPASYFKRFETYQDFAFGAPANRLGGALPTSAPPAPPEPIPGSVVDYPRSDENPEERPVRVRADGAILHSPAEEPSAETREAAHHYMHDICDYILYRTRDLLEAINWALSWYNEDPTNAPAHAAHVQAVTNFEKFRAIGAGSTNPYNVAFTKIDILPVQTNEGYFVSVRVELTWKNPRHSSSTVQVP